MSSEIVRRVAKNSREKETRTRETLKRGQHSLAHAVSQFMALPGKREAWSMADVDYANPQVPGLVNGHDLTNNNASNFSYDGLAPYVDLVPGSSQFLNKADGGAGNWADVTGTEVYIQAAKRGLYVGGWFWLDAVATNISLIGKWNDAGVNQRSFMIFLRGANSVLEAHVSGLGTAASTIIATSVALSAGQWYFAMLNFDPSTLLSLWLGDSSGITQYTTAAAATAAVFDSTADFTVGRYSGPPNYMDGRASVCALGAMDLGTAIIPALFHQTRALYGV